MSFITTTLCIANRVDVKPVKFCRSSDGSRVLATQSIVVTLEDGKGLELNIHLAEGTTPLAAGEAVVFPSVDEVTA
ncbi:hypothetical protein ACQUJT_11840 [Ralstonia pseudosolanacearum]|uniref:Uncharacterized protein n=1 Tax=Ralstonia solanacearum TaxID=305 RepID=A0A0S4TUV9_RALSL|nr:hypothetical protein RSP799_06790 [Ralstonia solanacearum]CUV13828.1 conserved protein of unknown function [Ralstonia solanacearum]